MKEYKAEKYIYLLMAYMLAKNNNGSVSIGKDNNMVGGQNFWRRFSISEYQGKTILTETKTSPHFADFSRFYQVIDGENTRTIIKEYINESGENGSKSWVH